MAKGFVIGAALVGAVMVSACSTGLPQLPPLTAQQQAGAIAAGCLTMQMAPLSLACTQKYQDPTNKTADSNTLASCMAAAQISANAACAPQIGAALGVGAPVAK